MLLRSSVVLALCASPALAHAGSVYLNGVDIAGVTSQTFNNCTVTIDAGGNIFIDAKGYAVAGQAGQPTAAAGAPGTPAVVAPQGQAPVGAPAKLTQRYWVVTEKAAPGMAQYDVDLFVNSKFVRRFLDAEEHVVLEVTSHMAPGQNKVVLVARKNLKGSRRSTSPQHYFRIVIGEGESGGRNVMIHRKLVDYKKTAADTADSSDEFLVSAE